MSDTNTELALRRRLDPGEAQDADDDLVVYTQQAPVGTEDELTRQRIINTLEIYPKVSPSMLQAAIGPHNKPQFWRPILESLIEEGIVTRDQKSHRSERGRYRILIIISLSEDYLAAKAELEAEQAEQARAQAPSGPAPVKDAMINPLVG